MTTIFMNSENSKNSSLHSLVLNLTDKIDLKRGDAPVASSNLSILPCKENKFNISDQHGTMNLSCQTGPIPY